MSIVVAVKKNGRIVMAADTLSSFGEAEMSPTANSRTDKIYRFGSSILGSTGWAVYDDILSHYVSRHEMPDLTTKTAIFSFFMQFWKDLHESYPFVNDQAINKESPFGDLDSSFLFANANGIFKVSSDMCVSPFNQYYTIGSGSEYALGALYNLYDALDDPAEIARYAVRTACQFDVHCGGEIDVLEVEQPT
ncbi:MAG: hypothetical protein O7G85_13060 [Planctomycetota bacterium]|nr:hypothetical protein [Planctomycetota bacterium]